MVDLAKLKGVNVDRMELVAKIGGYLLNEDFFASGRTLKALGLENMSQVEFQHYLETGRREPL
jgi:hypothetical protein